MSKTDNSKKFQIEKIIIGQYDTIGNSIDYKESIEVSVFGRTLRDNDGMIWGIQDSNGDWVHPTMYGFGTKCKLRFADLKADTSVDE
jgi:hypothetical protein